MQPAKELEEKKYVGLMVYFCITMPFTSIILIDFVLCLNTYTLILPLY